MFFFVMALSCAIIAFAALNAEFITPARVYYVATDIASGRTLNQAIKANNDYTVENNNISKIVFDKYDSVENDIPVYTEGEGYNILSGLTGVTLDWDDINVEIYRVTNEDNTSTVYILSTSDITCSADMSNSFRNLTALKEIVFNNFNLTSSTTNLSNMFRNCSSLENLNLNSFDTSQVTNMAQMFSVCTSLTSLNISNFNTSNVSSFNYIIAIDSPN